MNNTPWMPNGKMKDVTLVFGSCKTKPNVSGDIHEIIIDKEKFYVSLCCNKPTLTNDEYKEIVELCKRIKLK